MTTIEITPNILTIQPRLKSTETSERPPDAPYDPTVSFAAQVATWELAKPGIERCND